MMQQQRPGPPGATGPPSGVRPPQQMQAPPPQMQQRPPPQMMQQPPPQQQQQQQQQRPPPQMQQPPPQMMPQRAPAPAPVPAPLPVRKPAAAPAPAEEDEVEDDEYGYDEDFDDFDEEEEATKPPAAAAPAAKPAASSAAAAAAAASIPNSSAIQQMIAQENRSLAQQQQQQQQSVVLGRNQPGTATLSASSAAAVPARKYVPIQSKAARATAAVSKELLRKNARARTILQHVSLSIERFDVLFNLDPLGPGQVYTREVRRGMVREAPCQYNDDWMDKETATEAQETFGLGIQVPDDQSNAVVRRESSHHATATSTSTSTSTGTGPDATESYALASISTQRLNKFVSQASAVVEALLLESGSASGHFRALPAAPTAASGSGSGMEALSAAWLGLTLPAAFGPRRITDVHFSPARNQTLLVAYAPVDMAAVDPASSPPNHGGHQPPTRPFEGLAEKGLVCVWDMGQSSFPRTVLSCEGTPSCVCVDGSRGGAVVAGLEEGSLALWDLREDPGLHRSVTVPAASTTASEAGAGASASASHTHTLVVRSASFTTELLRQENHQAPLRRVVSLAEYDLTKLALPEGRGAMVAAANKAAAAAAAAAAQAQASSSSASTTGESDGAGFDLLSLGSAASASGGGGAASNSGSSANFQVASLDEVGGLAVWTAIELKDVDPAGSEVDLGLAPGARVKLVRSALLRDGNVAARAAARAGTGASSSTSSVLGSMGVQSFDVAFKPDETNEYVLALGKGQLRRGRRYGGKTGPSDYYQNAANMQLGDDCSVIAFNPFHPSYFLAGYKSGCVSLYSLECATSLASWLHLYSSASEERLAGGYAGPRSGVVGLRWSAQRPSLFFVTDARGKCVAFDLLKNEQKPVATVSIGAGAAAAGAAAGGMGAPLPVPGQAQPSSLPPPLPLLALSATVPGSSMALNQAMMAFPAPGAQPTVQVHMLRPEFANSTDKERLKFAEYLAHVHAL